ncbi:hypothetical protein APS56_06300 [Pseudalgibacter alginicilyticus]|uniref:Uncharacterized protein n=1 Tax=Pseudalgibacter alginicilyticus TaxID=1736674 RepID=A0A0N7HYB1_9FLAO|nr:hypothetical protein [Pseudalgibacter alginicilyticus]ALJ04758.1 hypothetical protein APS56_06300 [Pseudalgibacter alginicilyticus]
MFYINIIFIELKGWANQLQYIDTEVDKLLNLYAQSIYHQEVPKNILTLFSKRKEANTQLLYAILSYTNNYKKVSECDNIQCDMAFLVEYERLRKSYQYHISKYQKLKDSLYNMAFQKI